ncbi:MAG: hypothetical protein ABIU87_13820 [Ornithinibacter sp.]
MDEHPAPNAAAGPAPRAPLYATWVVVRVAFFSVLGIWVLIGVLALVRVLATDPDAAGTVRCPAGSYPASAAPDAHRCFPTVPLPLPGSCRMS